MKHILTIYFIYCATITYSQDTIKFLSTIYVKDAIGNIDSVTIGSSYYANSVYNPEFGELALDTPFDSTLEVRAGHGDLWAFLNKDYILSKKIISASERMEGKGGVPIRLFIYAKHQPVTISWSEEFLNPRDFLGTFMTPDAHHDVVNPIWWWEGNPVRFQCMNKFTSYTVALTSEAVLDFEFPYHVTRPVLGSENEVDTIYGVQITFAQHEMYSPCQLVSNIEEDIEHKRLSIYPNPAHEYINFSSSIDLMELYNLEGKLLKKMDESGEYFIGDLQQGVYIIRGKINSNWYSGKLIKI
ncbi:MAG TPA: T9SS type A sorting domain-containing protein [Saprospiraceae bacterium]|jgi:hypothetical protein|nr:T9SS type A sorting domain-containing protein [Saprospiraceae bacterium]